MGIIICFIILILVQLMIYSRVSLISNILADQIKNQKKMLSENKTDTKNLWFGKESCKRQ